MIVELYRLLQRSLLTVKSIECVIEQALQLASGTRDGFIMLSASSVTAMG